MNSASMAPLMSSVRQDHNTPLEVLAPIRRFDEIGLDPCSNAQSIVGARVEWRLERGEDGLRRSWGHFTSWLVFVNWPYEDGLAWSKKMLFEARRGVEIIGLGPSRTDTEWFQDYVAQADALCFWRGRIKFGAGVPDVLQRALFPSNDAPQLKEPESCAPFPSVLPYFGPRAERFKEIFREVGWCP